MPASIYNLLVVLLERSPEGVVFVPIRSMQYLAIADREEIIFLDSERKSWIEIAWQHFHPQRRSSLADPVPYEAVYYATSAQETMKRLQSEFPAALKAMAAKDTPSMPARIIKLGKPA